MELLIKPFNTVSKGMFFFLFAFSTKYSQDLLKSMNTLGRINSRYLEYQDSPDGILRKTNVSLVDLRVLLVASHLFLVLRY